MSTRARIISFFGIITTILFAGGIYIGISSGNLGSSAETSNVPKLNISDINLSIDDHVNSVTLGSKTSYTISVQNKSTQNNIQSARIRGFLGVPSLESGKDLARKLTSWFGIFLPSQNLPKDRYINLYLGDLPPGGSVTIQLPIEVKIFESGQNIIYSQVTLSAKVPQKRPFWELLSLSRASYETENLMSAEDLDSIQ